jgi:hypothetical protein
MATLNNMIFAINSIQELKEAQAALTVRWRELERRTAVRFSPGDFVTFADRAGRPLRGCVVKVNTKTVKVQTMGGVKWNVSPSLLHAA